MSLPHYRESVEFAPGKIRKRPTNENQGHDLTPLSHNNNNNNSQEPSGLLSMHFK